MLYVAYLLLGIVAYIYIRVLFSVWEQRKKDRIEWEQYWDDIFERNKNL